jgi:predicted permease
MLADLRLALRQLRQHPGFAVVAVLTLAIGIGANTALFSIVNGVILRPLPFPKHEQLATLWESNPALGADRQKASWVALESWRAQERAIKSLGYWTGPEDFNFVTSEGVEKVRTAYVSSDVFPTLQISPQLGRGFAPEEDNPKGPMVALISHQLWQNRFGLDPRVLGQTVTIDTYGKRTYTIVGVMPAGFSFPDATELWLPAGYNGLPRDRRTPHWLNVIARLADGVTIPQARAALNTAQATIARENPNARAGTEVAVVPLLQQLIGGRTRTALFVLWGVVGGVLLIACANVANLMLARATARQKEIALRLALGAGRGRIVRQLLTESVLLSLLGGVAGALLAVGCVNAIIAFSPADIPRLSAITVDLTALSFTAGIAVLTGIVFGLTPAWQCSRPQINETLKATGSATSAAPAVGRTRGALVIIEMALATVLLVVASLMLQSFAKLIAADRGFRAEHVITAELDFSVSGFTSWVEETGTRPQSSIQRLIERLRQLPNVQAAGAAYGFPTLRRDNLPPNNTFTIFGRPAGAADVMPVAYEKSISPGYLNALGVTLLRGRDFTDTDTLRAPSVALINESFARRYFGDEDPIGQYITQGRSTAPLEARDTRGLSTWTRIVGVVKDTKSLTQQPEAAPEVYRSYWQWPMQAPVLFVRTMGDPAPLANALRRETKLAIPLLPSPKIRLMTDRVNESVAQPRFQAGLLNLFGGIGLLLAACGIYGVLAYAVIQRRREIGIRMALGAQGRDVISLVLTQGMRLAFVGAVVGIAAAAMVTRVLRAQLYAVSPADPLAFAAAALALLGVALLACWLPARAAARTDPIIALRCE